MHLQVVYSSQGVEDCLQNNQPFVYFVRQGRRFNGYSLCEKILTSGNAVVGLKDQLQEYAPDLVNHPLFFAVENLDQSLHAVLDHLYMKNLSSLKSIGVTGTNGKTSFVQIAGFLLEKLTQTPVLRMGTLGLQLGSVVKPTSHVTTPDYPTFLTTLHQGVVEENVSHVCIEVTSHGLQEGRLGNWLFDTVVFTNLTQDHLDFHGTMEAYRQAKHKLFANHLKPHRGCTVVSVENQEWKGFLQQAKSAEPQLVIGTGNTSLEKDFFNFCQKNKIAAKVGFLGVTETHHSLQGWQGTFVYNQVCAELAQPTQKMQWTCPLVGLFHLENILCAVASLQTLGFDLREIVQNLQKVLGIVGRFQKVILPLEVQTTVEKLPQKAVSFIQKDLPHVFVDYAHTPDALERVLQTARGLLPATGTLWVVFGCGGDRDTAKRPLMGRVAQRLADVVILTSDNPRTEDPESILNQIYEGLETSLSSHLQTFQQVHRVVERRKAIFQAILQAKGTDVVVIAGKGHEKTQTIGTVAHPFFDEAVAQEALQECLKNGVTT